MHAARQRDQREREMNETPPPVMAVRTTILTCTDPARCHCASARVLGLLRAKAGCQRTNELTDRHDRSQYLLLEVTRMRGKAQRDGRPVG